MKITLHIPVEQYGFVAVEMEGEEISEGNAEAVADLYRYYQDAFKEKNGAGIPSKEYNTALDEYLTSNTGNTETYLAMSPEQQRVFQEIKKSLKRIKAKEDLPTVNEEE